MSDYEKGCEAMREESARCADGISGFIARKIRALPIPPAPQEPAKQPPAEPLYPPHGEPVYTEEEYAAAKKQPPAVSDESACPVNADGAENRTPADAARARFTEACLWREKLSRETVEPDEDHQRDAAQSRQAATHAVDRAYDALLHAEQQEQGREQPQGGGE